MGYICPTTEELIFRQKTVLGDMYKIWLWDDEDGNYRLAAKAAGDIRLWTESPEPAERLKLNEKEMDETSFMTAVNFIYHRRTKGGLMQSHSTKDFVKLAKRMGVYKKPGAHATGLRMQLLQ